jgi:hypothetical protein
VRLSFLELMNESEAIVFGRWEGAGRVGVLEERFDGAVGAWEMLASWIERAQNRFENHLP